MSEVLLLNIDERPLNVFKFGNKAINKWLKQKADIVESIPDRHFMYEGKQYEVPTIMKMTYYVTDITKTRDLKDFYSKENVWKRDKGICQYCSKKVTKDEFTVDHVIPKKKGGKGTWDNMVTACFPCNNKKDCKSLKDSGMKLMKRPEAPKIKESIAQTLIHKFKHLSNIPYKSWEKYIK